MFKVLKLKPIIIGVVFVLISVFLGVGVVSVANLEKQRIPKPIYTIVIDPGHGGRDGGSIGKNGSVEKELNLKYAKTLQKMLIKAGVNVIMTRTNDEGLYSEDESNKKLSDMRARRDIIRKAQPDLVVSVHMNSFPLPTCKGAKTFYQQGSEASINVAKCIQNSLNYYIDNASNTVSAGDYYILNCTPYTSVLIECGFISNPSEEQLLNDNIYCEKLIYSVYCGIIMSLGI